MEDCPELVHGMQPTRWISLPMGCAKVNFDGANLHTQTATGIGGTCRNSEGECVAWQQHYREFEMSPEVAEAFATLDALQWARRQGWRDVIFEGDCMGVVKKIRANTRDLSPIETILSDIFSCFSFFNSVSFSFVRREGNHPAHLLAHSALLNLEGDGNPPPQVLDAVLADLI
ncbi:hypothetical protein BUALT_Bualt05G0077700 [Buddleja alternifolia]|uniref:RNase H type-1 domain-containing protein n=1 Tax=Buddleja alternifolia TaxID=168488 RepID=A0AAV6XQW5_9LAMI|nr:hypothetical protein BUALT_Bualt05G0077700 [Buddleja alternifolia]